MAHRPFVLLALVALLGGCQTAPDPDAAREARRPADRVAEEALEALMARNARQCPIEDFYTLEEPAEGHTSLWARLVKGFQLDLDVDDPRIDAELRFYREHPGYMRRVTERAGRYLYPIVEALEAEGMPLELALLPIVESAFDPFAYSPGQAAGLWQFIPATGKHYGLERNWWTDQRRDVNASTRAAVQYLKDMHRRLGDNWLHALAAYNTGEGNVRKAIRKNRARGKPTDFWALDLPRETENYAPKLIALARIFRDPEHYDLRVFPVPDRPYYATVDLDGQPIDLAVAATLANVPIEEIYRLNPGLNRWSTPPDGPHRINVPLSRRDTFLAGLAVLPPSDRVRWVRHRVEPGDTLGTVAQRYHTSVGAIQKANRLRDTTIRVGTDLMIPAPSQSKQSYTLSADGRHRQRLNRPAPADRQKAVHRVQSGESWWEIARDYDVTVGTLTRWNNRSPRDLLRVGEKLVVWHAADAPTPPSLPDRIRRVHYTVRSGDSLYLIAQRFRVSVSDIAQWNDLDRQRYLQPGQGLTLYVNVTR